MRQRKVEELTPHPLNKRIYGDKTDDELVESVREHGILTPLIITAEDIVVSGHRRLDAARKLGLPTAPVTERSSSDGPEAEQALITATEQRQRTVEQKTREFMHLRAMAARRAKQRQVEAAPGARMGDEAGASRPVLLHDGRGRA